MRKRYNSVIGILASIDHDIEDGSDVTADEIRQRLREQLASMPNDELLEASGFTDTYERDPDTRPLNVYRVSATDHVDWTCNVVARDAEEAYGLANAACTVGMFEKGMSYEFQIHAVDEANIEAEGVKPTDDPYVWVTSDGETINAFGEEVDDV